MTMPFVLLDDARESGAGDALLFEHPEVVRVARRPEQVAALIDWIEAERAAGATLAGYLSYEAGLAMEPRLEARAGPRTGAAGPLGWFARFAGSTTIPSADVPRWLAQRAPGDALLGPVEPQLSLGAYAAAFARLREAIAAGDIYQANLTFPIAGRWRGEPLALHARLRGEARAGYGAVVFDGSHWLLSWSPELFVAIEDREITARPMKGTAPRLADPAADAAAARALAGSAKDRAENLMIVDLIRNDVSRVSEAGSVRVDHANRVESYPTVHQMTSTIGARLADGSSIADLVRAMFPCGSITGAPKIRAMELIDEVERDARGIYCGAIGRVGPGGIAAFNVAIRTLRLDPATGQATGGLGSAIVADSTPLEEWRECLVKGDFLRRSAAAFDLIETMAFDPATGIALLELHLARLTASAAELGFSFDRHAARNAIHALCFDSDRRARLRLVLARGGEIALELAPLPEPPSAPWTVAILPLPVVASDLRLRHKTSDRGFYEDAMAIARRAGADECLFLRDDGLLTEGTITNLFVARDDGLVTPPLSSGLLPGVLRQNLIDQGRAHEGPVRLADLSDGFFLGNAVRGLVPARLI